MNLLDIDRITIRHEYGIDLDNSEIDIMGEEAYAYPNGEPVGEPGVEFAMANRVIRNIRLLTEKNKKSKRPILFHLKTCGGDWHEGQAIHYAIRQCPLKTIILNHSHARSMSSMIFQAADLRLMQPDSIYMIHRGSIHLEGEERTVESDYDFYRKEYNCSQIMLNLYIDALKRNPKMGEWPRKAIQFHLWRAMQIKGDYQLTTQGAVNNFFADEIFDGDYERVKSRSYLKKFNKNAYFGK